MERMIDHYSHRPTPLAPAGPVPVERMIDHYSQVTPKSYSPNIPT
jgi:hypothetical protein